MAIGEAKTEAGKTVYGTFLSLREVAQRVKTHPSTILRWVKNKKVAVKPYKNSRGHWVFRQEDVSAFELFKNEVKPVD